MLSAVFYNFPESYYFHTIDHNLNLGYLKTDRWGSANQCATHVTTQKPDMIMSAKLNGIEKCKVLASGISMGLPTALVEAYVMLSKVLLTCLSYETNLEVKVV